MREIRKATVAEWAIELGVSRKSGYEAIKRCGIPLVGGQVDVELATTLYRQFTRARANHGKADVESQSTIASSPSPSPSPSPDADDDVAPPALNPYVVDRARRERVEADLAEIELARKRNELYDRAAVDALLERLFGGLRAALLQLPDRLAPVLCGQTDQLQLRSMIDLEVRSLLDSAAR